MSKNKIKSVNSSAASKKQRLFLILTVAFAALLLLSAVGLGIGISERLGSSASEARKGVVYIYTEWADNAGNIYSASGSGWAVGKEGEDVQYIVTNGHVVDSAYKANQGLEGYNGVIQVVFSAAEKDFVDAQVVYFSDMYDHDIAILKLPKPTDKRHALALRHSDSVEAGEAAFALGFPGVSNILQSNIRLDENDVTMTTGIISKRAAVRGTQYEAFQMDVSINPGNSGGPLVDSKGFVLGVNTLALVSPNADGSTTPVGNVFYASVADQLSRILREEGIPFSSLGDRDWLIYVCSPLLVLSLLALGYVFMKRRSEKAGVPAQGGRSAGEGLAPRKGSPVLRGQTGKFAQKEFELQQKLLLGRDAAKCNIVYPTNSPGISAAHCSILYDAAQDCFLLTDLGSSFGTFLNNGRKLSPNVPEKLFVGDSFYLADGNNRFLVTKV